MASYVVIQISDVHLTAGGSLPLGVRPRDQLTEGLRQLESAGLRPDIFLLSGDLADAGDDACYQDLAGIVGTAAARAGAEVIYLPGNHDDRGGFRRHLTAGGGTGPVNQTRWRNGLRVIALDSTVPGQAHGELADETLAFLRSELEVAAPDGTIVALHHPPLPSPIDPLTEISLRDPDRLGAAIEGSDVRLVLCGHYHHEASGMLGRTPVWVSPATAYRVDVTRTQVLAGIPGVAFSRIDLSPGGHAVSVIPVPAVLSP